MNQRKFMRRGGGGGGPRMGRPMGRPRFFRNNRGPQRPAYQNNFRRGGGGGGGGGGPRNFRNVTHKRISKKQNTSASALDKDIEKYWEKNLGKDSDGYKAHTQNAMRSLDDDLDGYWKDKGNEGENNRQNEKWVSVGEKKGSTVIKLTGNISDLAQKKIDVPL